MMTIGFAMCGSFCTFEQILPVIKNLVKSGANVVPILSDSAKATDTRFGTAKDLYENIRKITGNEIIDTITKAEPIGPKHLVDIMVVAPCTGATLAKLANNIIDTPVTMAVKSHLRNSKPVVLGISTNDGLMGSAENIGKLLNKKSFYFVPFTQDDYLKKPFGLQSDFSLLEDTVYLALKGKQLQPILL